MKSGEYWTEEKVKSMKVDQAKEELKSMKQYIHELQDKVTYFE